LGSSKDDGAKVIPPSIQPVKPLFTTLCTVLALCLANVIPLHAAEPSVLSPKLFTVPEGLEVKLWAASPLLHNPTSIDTDKDGRLWIAEGVDYGAKHYQTQPGGDRIVVIDTDGDGVADKSWTFVQDPALRAPLGIAVIDNQVIVSMAPQLPMLQYQRPSGPTVSECRP